jgi:hypothetical protein
MYDNIKMLIGDEMLKIGLQMLKQNDIPLEVLQL